MLEVGKRRVANLGATIDPQAAEQLKSQSYVDDSILGGSAEDVARMRGERTSQGYTGTVAKILAKGAMSIKFMAVTGSDDAYEEEQLGGKCLGVGYRMSQDLLHFRIDPCFYREKSKSSDVARELVRLDKQGRRGSSVGEGLIHAAPSIVHGHGPVRPPGPGGTGARHRQAAATPAVLTQPGHKLGTTTCPRWKKRSGQAGFWLSSRLKRLRFRGRRVPWTRLEARV